MLHKSQTKLLAAIKKRPDATVRELQKTCRMSSPSVVQHHLLVLQAKGIIRKIDRWEIVRGKKGKEGKSKAAKN